MRVVITHDEEELADSKDLPDTEEMLEIYKDREIKTITIHPGNGLTVANMNANVADHNQKIVIDLV